MNQQNDAKKNRIFAILALGISFGFMICVFAPLEFYLSNKENLFFDGKDLLYFVVPAFPVVAALLSVFLIFVSKLNHRVSKTMIGLTFGMMIGLYIQGNYDRVDYGAWDGSVIDWNCFRTEGFLWGTFFVLCIVLAIIFTNKADEKKVYGIIRLISICLILIQLVTLVTLLINKKGLFKESEYVAVENGECEFSNQENLIVLILDSYDSMMLSEIIDGKNGQYYSDILKDFTFYPDTLGMYSYTNLAVPAIITGRNYYNDVTYGEYMENAYRDSDVLNSLRENGWNIGIYSDASFPNDDELVRDIENCRKIKRTVTSHRRLAEYMYRFVGFRYLPQPFKKYCQFYPGDMESKIGSNDEGYTLFGTMNKSFEKLIPAATADRSDKVFKLIHLYGAHPPYHINADNTESEEETSELDTCKGNLEMVNDFLKKLKDVGAYDNSTIIICADHGVMQLRQSPLFIVKYKGESHDLEISDTPFSYAEFSDVLKSVIKGYDADNTKGIIQENELKKRVYFEYSHDTLHYDSYCSDITEYELDGVAYIQENLHMTGQIYRRP